MDIILLLICCFTFLGLTEALIAVTQIVYFRKRGKIIGYRLTLNKFNVKKDKTKTNSNALRFAILKSIIFTILLTGEIMYVVRSAPEMLGTIVGCLVMGTIIIGVVQEQMISANKPSAGSSNNRNDEDWIV
jgi:hypothetical protein